MNKNEVIKYSDIIEKHIYVETKFDNKYGKLNGICISNPPIIENAAGKITPCLGMKTNYRTPLFDVTNKQFYVFNSLFPFDSEHSVYVPINEITSISVFKEDALSKLMLLWLGKKKEFPDDITRYIMDFMDGWKIKLSVINDYNNNEII